MVKKSNYIVKIIIQPPTLAGREFSNVPTNYALTVTSFRMITQVIGKYVQYPFKLSGNVNIELQNVI